MRCWRDFERSGVTVTLHGGGDFFCAVEQEQELGGIKAFAFGTEDAAEEGVDGLLELRDLGVPAGNLI